MKKSQSGFTLIELVVVIVLLGILGVTALGRFQDLSSDAQAAAIAGIASELTSASAINYAEGILDGTYTVTLNAADICTTAILDDLLQSQTWPTATPAYQLDVSTVTEDCSGGAGNSASCTIYQDTDGTAGYGAGDVQANAQFICTQ